MIHVKLTKGYVTRVSPCDIKAVRAHRWRADVRKLASFYDGEPIEIVYAKAHIAGKTVYLHRFILARKLGRALYYREECDHINGDGLLNARHNLRSANSSEQKINRNRRPGASGYRGVQVVGDRYRARIGYRKKEESLGTFGTALEAARAFDTRALELNFPPWQVNGVLDNDA
jgi:hypothetical protein